MHSYSLSLNGWNIVAPISTNFYATINFSTFHKNSLKYELCMMFRCFSLTHTQNIPFFCSSYCWSLFLFTYMCNVYKVEAMNSTLWILWVSLSSWHLRAKQRMRKCEKKINDWVIYSEFESIYLKRKQKKDEKPCTIWNERLTKIIWHYITIGDNITPLNLSL